MYRFPKRGAEDGRQANTHSVQHFWLCASCSEEYSLKYDEDLGITIGLQSERTRAGKPPRPIAAA